LFCSARCPADELPSFYFLVKNYYFIFKKIKEIEGKNGNEKWAASYVRVIDHAPVGGLKGKSLVR
jgi:hypothetical protein